MIIGGEEVYNLKNIDLSLSLGVKGQPNETSVVIEYIKECEEDILEYIKEHSYYPEGKMKYMREHKERFEPVLKRAVLEQIEYKLKNGDIGSELGIIQTAMGFQVLEGEEREKRYMAPRAVRLLENARLLYQGRA